MADRLTPERQRLVEDHVRYALAICHRVHLHTGASWDEEVDSAALEGLVRAARHYDMASPVPFRLYAAHRIAGAVRDEVRSYGYRRQIQSGRSHSVARAVPVDIVTSTREDLAPGQITEPAGALRADMYCDGDQARVEEILALLDEVTTTRGKPLPAVRRVAEEHWLAGRSLADIGDELGVTESRASQLLAVAKRYLADRLTREMAA